MSSSSRAWIVAASIGAVEALKDQGICRWNYTVRSAVQHAKNHLRSASQARTLPSQSSPAISKGLRREHKSRQSEESLRTVMYLSCWGPN
ncbi:Wound-induced polypeptide 3 [Hibiscus trionum]|uniref:Wound-induced polypeptide 3 n=1 Tax=Hibiscus trionum TaxID=183268 RepID=A0A9W7JJU9_HIBTR|nr:Wound-induced polypeptide 3 [Hibiscus trionum]